MSKVFVFMMVSLDGYMEGKNHDLSWHHVDAEFNEFSLQQLDSIDCLIFGRRTYDVMASYWPTKHALTDDTEVATRMNTKPKVVFSHSLKAADWQNTKLAASDLKIEMAKLKEKYQTIGVFGSSNLCVSLLKEGYLDELRLMINPVVIGEGTTLFSGLTKPLELNLLKTKSFASGSVLNFYKTI